MTDMTPEEAVVRLIQLIQEDSLHMSEYHIEFTTMEIIQSQREQAVRELKQQLFNAGLQIANQQSVIKELEQYVEQLKATPETTTEKVMLSLFDKSTNMAKPWAAAGYVCYCVDIAHPPGETTDTSNIIKVGADIKDWIPPQGVEFVAAFPPCTDVAVSGARWFKDKGLGKLINALSLFKRTVDLCEIIGAPYFIENPVSTVSSYWRKPDHTFDPCDYGDPWTKKTCLWAGNGFAMPPKNPVEPTEGSKMHLMAPSPDRADKRSETPMGFANAVFEANGRVLV